MNLSESVINKPLFQSPPLISILALSIPYAWQDREVVKSWPFEAGGFCE